MAIMTSLLLIAAFCAFLLFPMVEARGIWGSKRKRDEVEDINMEATINGDLRSSSIAPSRLKTLSNIGSKSFDSPSNEISKMIDAYISTMEELVNSPQFADLITPDTIRSMTQQIPGLSSFPEILTMIESPQFQDPEILKQTIKEGIKLIKAYSSQFLEILNDPSKIDELLAQLPLETRQAAEKLMSGDMTEFKSMIDNIPGLGSAQKKLLDDMMSGKTSTADGLVDTVKELLADGSQIEEARQQFLQDPSMAEALGIPMEVVRDKKAWVELMQEQMKSLEGALNSDNDAHAVDEDIFESSQSRKRFGGSSARAI